MNWIKKFSPALIGSIITSLVITTWPTFGAESLTEKAERVSQLGGTQAVSSDESAASETEVSRQAEDLLSPAQIPAPEAEVSRQVEELLSPAQIPASETEVSRQAEDLLSPAQIPEPSPEEEEINPTGIRTNMMMNIFLNIIRADVVGGENNSSLTQLKEKALELKLKTRELSKIFRDYIISDQEMMREAELSLE